ncbi:transmembrane protein, putative (macronuclear) [Tetrahymena thermophila SB210]|uniref:Transmembrane protein, putative n=1 Tax=Tetrahymena thermophila (strain SB210) TaxID=312017 RepID=I7M7R5_TETTS|nr:transmembrane protein, putative [Tetrahymena thermophila SB210]EAR95703.2 transmembrane protein, putative [Tetrahymena thermophila SB210]|eukprot:XP_001015948.2 transmembrane protein, putative [Tetrahymena thermophila SB210]
MCIIVLIPLTIVCSIKIFQNAYNNQQLYSVKDILEINPRKVDRYLRFLSENIENFYYNYQLNGQGISFENIYITHIAQCSYKNCFCSQISNVENEVLEKKEFVKQEERRSFILNFGDQIISQFLKSRMINLKRSSMMRLAFTHICFITEVMQMEAKAHFTIHFFKNQILKNKGISIEMYYLEVLQRRLHQQFQSKKIQKPVEFFNVLNIIDYDNNIARCKYILYNYLLNIRMYYDYLCSHNINLQELFTKSTKLIQSNHFLVDNLQDLFSLNPENAELQFLASIYTTLLDYENRKFEKFIHITPAQKSSNYLFSLRQYFQDDSCVVYSTFMKNVITIQKVSKQFEILFKFSKLSIKDKSINFLIPSYFQADHEDIIDIFRNKGQMQILVKERRLIFAQDGQGFLLPLYIILKIENQINDFGISALFKRVDVTKDYIFLKEDNQILDMTENIFKVIFQASNLTINELRENFALQLIPLLWITEEAKEYGIEYNTILVVCQSFLQEMSGTQYSSLSKRKQVKELLYNVLDQSEESFYYNISFKHCVYHLSQLNKTYKYIEINYIHEEKSQSNLDLSLHYLTRGLNDLIAKKIIQSKESTQLRLFKRKQDTEQTHTITTIYENQQSRSDWGTQKHRNSITTPENKNIKIVHRKSFLSTYAQNNTQQKTQKLQEQDQGNIESITQRELNVTNADLSIADQTLRFINKNEQLAENSLQINHIEVHNQFNEHLNFSQRNLISQNQESFYLSPLYQQQAKSSNSPKADKNQTKQQEDLAQKQNSKQKNLSLEKQLRKKLIQDKFSAADLKKIEEEYILNYQKNPIGIQDQLKDESNNRSILDFTYNQEEDNNSNDDEESINSEKTKNEIDLNQKDKLQENNNNNDEKISQEKMNLRRCSIQMQINIENNYKQDESEQISPTLLRNDQDKSKRNLLSLKLINLNNEEQNQKQGQERLKLNSHDNDDDDNITISDQQRLQIQLRRSATQSSKISSNHSQKKNIILKIKSQKIARFLVIMKFICFLSLLAFLLSTLIMYINSQNSLLDFQDVLVYIDMPIFIVSDVLKIIKSTTYNYLVKVAYDTVFDDSAQDTIIDQAQNSRQDAQNTLESFSKLYLKLHDNMDYSDKTVVFLSTSYTQIDFFTFGMLSQEQFDDFKNLDAYTKETKIVNYFDLVTQYYSNMYKYIVTYDQYIQNIIDGISNVYSYEMNANFLWMNLSNFTDQMYKFNQFVSQYVQNSFQEQEDFQIYVMTVILVVCCVSIFSVIPLNATKQYSREKILKLFGSFPPQTLNKQIQNIDNTINLLDQKFSQEQLAGQLFSNQEAKNQENSQMNSNKRKKSRKQTRIEIKQLKQTQLMSGLSLNSQQIHHQLSHTQFPFSSQQLKSEQQLDQSQILNQRNNNKRNRQIASFKGLPKFQVRIFFIALVIISVLMVQPTITIILTKTFIDEQRTLIKEKTIILQTLEQVVQNVASHYALFDFISRGKIAKETIYFQYLSSVSKKNNQRLQNLSSLVSFFSQARRDKHLFEEFYKQLLNGDICEVQQNFKQFFNSSYTETQCDEIFNNVLQRGLIISTKQAFDIWDDLQTIYEFYDSGDPNDPNYFANGFYELVKIITQNNDYLFQINDLNTFLIQSLEAIISYQNYIQKDYGAFIKNTYEYLFITQLIIIFLVFSLGWLILFKLFNEQMIQTKQIFTLFHIDVLAENNFILQYFKDNNFGIK